VDLERLAARLPGRRHVPTHMLLDGLAGAALPLEEVPGSSTAAAPPLRACAVIGCRRPVRSLGYCAAHERKRRLLEATGRLPPAWVEDAAPHSLPDVILTRERRAETENAAPPAEEARPETSPRVWVRKKGQPVAQPSSPEQGPPAPPHGPARPQQLEDSTIMATVERWAAEFRAGKHRG
jgi:hypothetical protein